MGDCGALETGMTKSSEESISTEGDIVVVEECADTVSVAGVGKERGPRKVLGLEIGYWRAADGGAVVTLGLRFPDRRACLLRVCSSHVEIHETRSMNA